MKKMKLFNSIIATPLVLAGLSPALMVTSCNKNTNTLLISLEEATINEFSKLCLIPHSSDKFLYKVEGKSRVQTLSNYLKTRAEVLTNQTVNQDNFGNIWFDVPANDDSLIQAPIIALQAHMDMVFAFDPTKYPQGVEPDASTTPIDMVLETVNGKRVIHSRNYKTNVGGDNGIGIAAILALIGNNDVKHGNLRIIFTNCEENAMQGAVIMTEGIKNAEGKVIVQPTAKNIMKDVKYVVNMDGGIGSGLCVACSGAVGGYYTQTFDPITPTLQYGYKITIEGFTGGHSGNARNHIGNALKAMNETLVGIQSQGSGIEIESISTPGTTVYNVIPPRCEVTLKTGVQADAISTIFDNLMTQHKKDGSLPLWTDVGNAKITVEAKNDISQTLSAENSAKIITLQDTLPYGPDEELEKQHLKTSANIAPATLSVNSEAKFDYVLETYSRSDSEDQIKKYRQDNETAAKAGGFAITDSSFHPWKEETNTKLFDLTSKALNNVGIKSITKEYAHGGVEPAMWSWAMINNQGVNDGNCVCIGVNVADEHKPTESIDVESIQTCMKVVSYIFENSKDLN